MTRVGDGRVLTKVPLFALLDVLTPSRGRSWPQNIIVALFASGLLQTVTRVGASDGVLDVHSSQSLVFTKVQLFAFLNAFVGARKIWTQRRSCSSLLQIVVHSEARGTLLHLLGPWPHVLEKDQHGALCLFDSRSP